MGAGAGAGVPVGVERAEWAERAAVRGAEAAEVADAVSADAPTVAVEVSAEEAPASLEPTPEPEVDPYAPIDIQSAEMLQADGTGMGPGGSKKARIAAKKVRGAEVDRLKDNALVQNLVARSKENKEKYDQQRLDSYYERNYNINELMGKEIIPEPCDPRDDFCDVKDLPAPF